MNTTEIETINKEGFKIKQRYAFIPKRLELQNHPELTNFPFNILFVSYKTDGQNTVSGTAVYYPQLTSFYTDKEKQSLMYTNIYKQENLIIVNYFPDTGKYEGNKFIDDKSVSLTFGVDWQNFFVHLTAGGLAPNEGCEFEDVTNITE